MSPLNHLHIPEFHEFVTTASSETCRKIDSTRLMVEILWWVEAAKWELSESSYSSKILLDGNLALVIRYKRERDGEYRPTCMVGYDVDESGTVHINQIQGSRDKNIAFRFHATFRTNAFLLKLFEESFLKKWIPVRMCEFPVGVENASHASMAMERYRVFQSQLLWLNRRYFWG